MAAVRGLQVSKWSASSSRTSSNEARQRQNGSDGTRAPTRKGQKKRIPKKRMKCVCHSLATCYVMNVGARRYLSHTNYFVGLKSAQQCPTPQRGGTGLGYGAQVAEWALTRGFLFLFVSSSPPHTHTRTTPHRTIAKFLFPSLRLAHSTAQRPRYALGHIAKPFKRS